MIELETRILAKNDALAAAKRAWFAAHRILALNLVSAPGAGKTSLLERTIRDLAGTIPLSVLEGDQATLLDGDRIRAAGTRWRRSIPALAAIWRPTWWRAALAELRPEDGSIT